MKSEQIIKLNKKGQSLVEFALVIPVFLSLILGMLEFGWIFNGQITLTSAAREGARTAIIYNDDNAETKETVTNAVRNSAGASSLKNISVNTTFVSSEAIVVVNAEIEPLVGLFVDDNVNLTGTAIMRLE